MLSDMMINRRRVYGGSKKLPYDAEIEYLESSGNQYIDTGVVLDATMTVRVLYDYIQYGFVFGARNNNPPDHDRYYSGVANEIGEFGYHIRYGDKILYHQNTNPHGTNDVVISPTGVVLNGKTVSVSTYGNKFFSGHCFLFTINQGGSPYLGAFAFNRIRRFSIDNIIDLIPVRVGQVGYMYDKVSKQLFGNSGTGDFILGPDK